MSDPAGPNGRQTRSKTRMPRRSLLCALGSLALITAPLSFVDGTRQTFDLVPAFLGLSLLAIALVRRQVSVKDINNGATPKQALVVLHPAPVIIPKGPRLETTLVLKKIEEGWDDELLSSMRDPAFGEVLSAALDRADRATLLSFLRLVGRELSGTAPASLSRTFPALDGALTDMSRSKRSAAFRVSLQRRGSDEEHLVLLYLAERPRAVGALLDHVAFDPKLDDRRAARCFRDVPEILLACGLWGLLEDETLLPVFRRICSVAESTLDDDLQTHLMAAIARMPEGRRDRLLTAVMSDPSGTQPGDRRVNDGHRVIARMFARKGWIWAQGFIARLDESTRAAALSFLREQVTEEGLLKELSRYGCPKPELDGVKELALRFQDGTPWLSKRPRRMLLDLVSSNPNATISELDFGVLKNVCKALLWRSVAVDQLERLGSKLTPYSAAKFARALEAAIAHVSAIEGVGGAVGNMLKGLTITYKFSRSVGFKLGEAKTAGEASLSCGAEIGISWTPGPLIDGARARQQRELLDRLGDFLGPFCRRLDRMCPTHKAIFYEELKDVATVIRMPVS